MVVTSIDCDVFFVSTEAQFIFFVITMLMPNRTNVAWLTRQPIPKVNIHARERYFGCCKGASANFVQWGIHFSSEKENCNERQDNLLMRTVITPNLGWCKLVFTWLLGLFLSCILRLRVKGKVVWIIQFYKICFSGWLIKVSIDWMMNNKG